MNINWVHFSDFDGLGNGNKRLDNRVLFLKDIDFLKKKYGCPDMVFIAGDLAEKPNDSKEYDIVNDMISSICIECKRIPTSPRDLSWIDLPVFAVPGNQDQRSLSSYSDNEIDILSKLCSGLDQRPWFEENYFLGKYASMPLSVQRFEEYCKWWKSTRTAKKYVLPPAERIQPGDYAASYEINNFRIGVIGLNSALASLNDFWTIGDHIQFPHLNHNQVVNACNKDIDHFFNQHHIVILLTHHSPFALLGGSYSTRFSLSLCGDMDSDSESRIHVELAKSGILQSPSLFGRQRIDRKSDSARRNYGYNFCQLKISNQAAQLAVWPRLFQELYDGTRRFVSDRRYELDSNECFKLEVPLRFAWEPSSQSIGVITTSDKVAPGPSVSARDSSTLPQKSGEFTSDSSFIISGHIEELKKIRSKYDLSRAIKFCEEINLSYANNNLLSVLGNIRGLLNHIPPVFEAENFVTLVSQWHGGKTEKKILLLLQEEARQFADYYAHDMITHKAIMPTKATVDGYRASLDFLIQQIIVKTTKKSD